MLFSKYLTGKMKRIKFFRSIFIIGLIMIGIVTNIVLHEFGHTLPAIFKGGSIKRIVVLGYEIIPNFGVSTHFGFSFSFSNVNWPNGYDPTEFMIGLEQLSGAGFTLLVSFISVLLLLLIRARHMLRYILLVLSYGFLDMFTFTFLPLFGLPHRLFAGGVFSETTEGMLRMGFSKTISLLIILFCVSVAGYLLYYYLKNISIKKLVF
jgi:hypothetical protein